MLKGTAVCALVAAAYVGLSGPSPAAAQPNMPAAAKAFSLGQQAELAGDHRAASEHYELADRMVPSAEALRSAARARLRAGHEAVAATHADALERRYSDEKSKQVASEILESLRPVLARVSLTCTPACGVVVDGGAIGVEDAGAHVFYLEPGRHTVGASFGSAGTQQESVEAQAGKSLTLALALPEPAAPRASAPATSAAMEVQREVKGAKRRAGLSPAWLIASTTITLGLTGAAIWSGLDVLEKNDAYEQEPTQARLDEGQSAENRTNLLLVGAGVGVAVTAIVAWRTRWSSEKRASAASTIGFAPSAGAGALVVIGGSFR
jgi:hypothetical protein